MAITVTARANYTTSTDAAAFTTGTFTPTTGTILIATVMNTKGSTPDAVNTFTDTNLLTWNLVHTVVDNGSLRRITQFWALVGASPVQATAVADFNAATQTSCYIHIAEFTSLNTTLPIGIKNTANPSGTSTSLALALTYANSADGAYFVIGCGSASLMSVSNGQLVVEDNVNTPTTRMLVGWDSVNQASPGATFASSARWGAGFELINATPDSSNWGSMIGGQLNRLVIPGD